MNRNQRRMAAYNARKSSEQIERQTYIKRIDRAFTKLSEGCTAKVARAINGPSVRDVKEESGAMCLPDVAIFAAGYRKPTESVTAR